MNHHGLSSAEAQKLLAKFGPNEIKQNGGIKWYMILLDQFLNVMMLILALAMVVSGAVGEILDAAAIGVIILINAAVGFMQEFKAERAIEALRKMTAPYAVVKRD